MLVCKQQGTLWLFGNVIKPGQASQSRDTRPSFLYGQGFKSN